ncbi:hypothetical protein [Asticcacaulis sp. AC402]|uniref:hypothetical protein n=1 Tax=Asticcacaulis sp. AC402 TaxID=1282361 RepID=UPI0003C3C456|nr:hypothetical protein [Asticcacaulis sp. AC402]ESQ74966.1 hypothetical protein ABAC402_11220 [Asticcacaulis sp. AC402]
MDTLDKLTNTSTPTQPRADIYNDGEFGIAATATLEAKAEDIFEDVKYAARKINWMQVAGFAAAGLAVAAAGYALYRSQ